MPCVGIEPKITIFNVDFNTLLLGYGVYPDTLHRAKKHIKGLWFIFFKNLHKQDLDSFNDMLIYR